jgi:hypothetical protein
MGGKVDGKEQKEYLELGGRAVDCRIGGGGKVKRVKISIRD